MSANKTLVIVESPTKAKTIAKMLPRDFIVKSSFGHIRDLPKSKMGIDLVHNFEPQYVIPKDKKAHVAELTSGARVASRVILATDEDREGEAIAWHLAEALGLGSQKAEGRSQKLVERIVFHEITKRAIEQALAHPRSINQDLVDAQQARRVLDRLVGYELSPFLWRKVARGLSAGRVQSAALRLIVEREEERDAFKTQEYWTIEAEMQSPKGAFHATLTHQDGSALDKFAISSKTQAAETVAKLAGGTSTITNIEKKSARRTPPPPFTTSTLQQEANRRLGFSAKLTMRLAQQLYEGIELGPEGHAGLITYMRTDSVNLSQDFQQEAKEAIQRQFGQQYWDNPRAFTTKSKLAQEAHEAIRPSVAARAPELVKPFLEPQQWKLYDLIWRRALASQMAQAEIDQTAVTIQTIAKTNAQWGANGSSIRFDGWLKLYPTKTTEAELPMLTQGQTVIPDPMIPVQHFTQPPARFSDATLVKMLEEHGIGRPSTYAPTISTIVERNYVQRDEDRRLKPTDVGKVVTKVLKEHFPTIVDLAFTATMEDDLDAVAEGKKKWQPLIAAFYEPFHENLLAKDSEVSKKELTEETSDEICPKCGKSMVIKMGRFGKFLACSGYPECKTTKPLASEVAENGGDAASQEPAPSCPNCGKPMEMKRGRFGSFWGCTGYPECKGIKRMERSTGVACPKCGKGEIVERRSKRGKTFYGCNTYPNCDFVLWSKPFVDQQTKKPKNCPTCKSLLVLGAKNTIRCSNKECDYAGEPIVY